MNKETIIPLSVYENAKRKSSSEINIANFSAEFKFNKKALRSFRKIVKKNTRRNTIKLFSFLNVFGLWIVPFANLRTRLYFEIHIFKFKWGCYIEGVKIWN